jgi:hypothetical protein
MSTPRFPLVPDVPLLPFVPKHPTLLESKEAVTVEIITWVKRRLMNKTFSQKELDELLAAVRAAGRAEGYAQARIELAMERAGVVQTPSMTGESVGQAANPPSREEKLETLKEQAREAEAKEEYKTRTTVTMTKTIALDYLRSVAPRLVGPSEIIKNTQKNLNLYISFGTLNRAMSALIETGDVEQTEKSRWRYRGRSELPLKSIR